MSGMPGQSCPVNACHLTQILNHAPHPCDHHACLQLVDIMRNESDPASRINAAVAVACLVGHEDSNPRLQLEEDLVAEMLKVRRDAHVVHSGAVRVLAG